MIKAECVAASFARHRIGTFKVTMPRYILAEFNTHRVFSRNSASSRAIPSHKMIQSVKNYPFVPMAWQADHKGMQGTEYIANETGRGGDVSRIEVGWRNAIEGAIFQAEWLNMYGLTKQMSNRVLEPFMWHTVLVTSTEWENFFNLRCPKYQHQNGPIFKSWKELVKHGFDSGASRDWVDGLENMTTLERLQHNKGQADIHMMAVAEAIYDAYYEADFKKLKPGQWHIPFGDQIDDDKLTDALFELNRDGFLFDDKVHELAKTEIAIARCARLSYQTLGDKPEIDYVKDLQLTNSLKQNGHWSPFEHVAYAMNENEYNICAKTIINKEGFFEQEYGWLANYRGWVQRRAVLENAP